VIELEDSIIFMDGDIQETFSHWLRTLQVLLFMQVLPWGFGPVKALSIPRPEQPLPSRLLPAILMPFISQKRLARGGYLDNPSRASEAARRLHHVPVGCCRMAASKESINQRTRVGDSRLGNDGSASAGTHASGPGRSNAPCLKGHPPGIE
jgi:hypothetical protein